MFGLVSKKRYAELQKEFYEVSLKNQGLEAKIRKHEAEIDALKKKIEKADATEEAPKKKTVRDTAGKFTKGRKKVS